MSQTINLLTTKFAKIGTTRYNKINCKRFAGIALPRCTMMYQISGIPWMSCPTTQQTILPWHFWSSSPPEPSWSPTTLAWSPGAHCESSTCQSNWLHHTPSMVMVYLAPLGDTVPDISGNFNGEMCVWVNSQNLGALVFTWSKAGIDRSPL